MEISFLIPVHNEEKRIGDALDSLSNIDYPVEILVYNDGSMDRTKEIIKKYDFVRYFSSSERKGKHNALKQLIKVARGDLIIIFDADYIFTGDIRKIIDIFTDERVGGLYIPNIFTEEEMNKELDGILQLGDAWNTYFIVMYSIKKYTINFGGKLFAVPIYPFFTNILRKNLFTEAHTLADDAERFFNIVSKGYFIRIYNEGNPRFKINYKGMNLKRLFNQRLRGFLAKKQIRYDDYGINIGLLTFYFPLLFFISKNLYRVKRLKAFFGILTWWIISLLAFVKSQFLTMTTKSGWGLR